MKYKHMPVKKYHSKYTDPNDNTSLNYLALAAAILDPNPKRDSRNWQYKSNWRNNRSRNDCH